MISILTELAKNEKIENHYFLYSIGYQKQHQKQNVGYSTLSKYTEIKIRRTEFLP